ncbi:MAG: acyl-CoA dehydrogenase [Chloroflexi bacterium]|nr:acyl-CoA dehydrogenase [Chloroflexota bacterium]
MDFKFTESEERLRGDLRAFLKETLPVDWKGTGSDISDDDFEFGQHFNKKLAERGWVAPAWPKQYGGAGATHVEQAIFGEELAYNRAPLGGRIFGVGMIGPTLIVHGSEEQKSRHLPGITKGDVLWCQGYSEPGAGSDLANLQTRAVRDGDDYVVNGQKIWTTQAQNAKWMFLLARTDPEVPKHKGISFFLVDMKTPGITVRPILNMVDRHEFNEVFFEDVRIPAKNLVGGENRGWYVAMTLLDFERSSIGASAASRRTLEEMARYATAARHNGGRVIDEDWVRQGLAELLIETEVARLMSYRVASMQQRGQSPNYEASMVKVFATESAQRMYNFGTKLLGLYGQLLPESSWVRLDGRIEQGYLSSVAPTIYSGSSEIQRNIIATRGLGLPRD